MQHLVYGLMTGSILAMAAAGFALIRKTEGFLNIAHGQLVALGAFLGYFFYTTAGLPIAVAAAAATLCIGALGLVSAVVVMQPMRSRGDLAQLFTSVGLAYIIYGVMTGVFGTNVRTYGVNFGAPLEFAGIRITPGELIIVAIVAATILTLHLFMTYTPLGMNIRATSSNLTLAQARGVRTDHVAWAVWFVASAFAGLSGVLLGLVGAIHAELGWTQILLILAATVLGGLGRIYGVVVASLALGMVMELSTLVVPAAYRFVVAFGVLIVILIFRPEGLFTVTRRRQAA
ncbi:branched-chain amino acid ABC transporter permease [soil metagenome]